MADNVQRTDLKSKPRDALVGMIDRANREMGYKLSNKGKKDALIERIQNEVNLEDQKKLSILPAWINNTIRSLTHPDPINMLLSGPKVDSFARNLMGEVDSVTLDTWMGHYALWKQKNFGGSMNKTDAGKGAGYLAYSAFVRKAAETASKLTGETWTPAEIQETVWSWSKTLTELVESKDETRTAYEIIRAGDLTHEMIADTPDFHVLFQQGVYRKLLERGGYNVETLGPGTESSGSDLSGSASTLPEGAQIAQSTFDRLIRRAARRLDTLVAARKLGQEAVDQLEFSTRPVTANPAFQAWFGGSRVLDENGQPRVLYHGTLKEFSIFDVSEASAESDMGAGIYLTSDPDDAGQNYANVNGPDVRNRIERLAEEMQEDPDLEELFDKHKEQNPNASIYDWFVELAEKEYADHPGAVYPVYVKMENPVVITSDDSGRSLTTQKSSTRKESRPAWQQDP
jgi:hypothetical protein